MKPKIAIFVDEQRDGALKFAVCEVNKGGRPEDEFIIIQRGLLRDGIDHSAMEQLRQLQQVYSDPDTTSLTARVEIDCIGPQSGMEAKARMYGYDWRTVQPTVKAFPYVACIVNARDVS